MYKPLNTALNTTYTRYIRTRHEITRSILVVSDGDGVTNIIRCMRYGYIDFIAAKSAVL